MSWRLEKILFNKSIYRGGRNAIKKRRNLSFMSDDLCSGCLKPKSKNKNWGSDRPMVQDGMRFHFDPFYDDPSIEYEFKFRVANNLCVCGF